MAKEVKPFLRARELCETRYREDLYFYNLHEGVQVLSVSSGPGVVVVGPEGLTSSVMRGSWDLLARQEWGATPPFDQEGRGWPT